MPKANRKAVTRWLGHLLMRDVFHVPSDTRYYWASEVTLENKGHFPGEPPQIRPDFIQFIPVNQTAGGIDRGEFRAFEIKSCLADFDSDHGHNFVGDKNYYVITQDLFDKLCERSDGRSWRARRFGFNVGVYVAVPGFELDDGEWEKSFLEDLPQAALLNPLTGKHDTTHLKCVLSADFNRRRVFSNTEMLFAMLRSAGRDRRCYSQDYWRNA